MIDKNEINQFNKLNYGFEIFKIDNYNGFILHDNTPE